MIRVFALFGVIGIAVFASASCQYICAHRTVDMAVLQGCAP